MSVTRYRRSCDCPHGFPLCACAEGVSGRALLDRSRWLSSLAGWPALVSVSAAVATLHAHRRPPADPPAGDCGCGGRA